MSTPRGRVCPVAHHFTAGAPRRMSSSPAPIDHAGQLAEYAGEGRPAGTAVAVVEPLMQRGVAVARTDPLLDAVNSLQQVVALAQTLLASGFLPAAIKTEAQAVAVMLTGREMGIGPMQAIRSVHIIDAKPVVAADLQLALFKRSGGRSTFRELSKDRCILWLRHPNGDEHVETWTWQDAVDAQLTTKQNWRKNPVAMMRSRVITAGLKSIGFEATTGTYDPDEADSWSPGASDAIAEGRDPNAGRAPTVQASARVATDTRSAGRATPASTQGQTTSTAATSTTSATKAIADVIVPDIGGEPRTESRYATRFPYGDHKGHALDALDGVDPESPDASYLFDDETLDKCGQWVASKLGDKVKPPKNPEKMMQLGKDLDAELNRRSMEADLAADSDAGV